MINSLNSNLNYDYNTSNFKQDKNIDFKINKHGVAVITGEDALPYRGKKFEYNPSPMLNNNRIIREITHQYKYAIEDAMGGWNPRLF